MRSAHYLTSLHWSSMNHHRAGRLGALDSEAIELLDEGQTEKKRNVKKTNFSCALKSTHDIFQGLDKGIQVSNLDMGPFRVVALGGVARWEGMGQSLVDMVPRDADRERWVVSL